MDHLQGMAISSGDVSQDLAFGLGLSYRRMDGLVSSMADELHQSAIGGLVGDVPKVSTLAPKSAQDGLKSAPGSQASEEAWTDNAPVVSSRHTSFKKPRRPRAHGLQEA